ncbi:ATP-dependent zinc metalloprotease FtsH, partial [Candidatus Berkelbacteria bacterium]|nr:ATP-dependent zinc metalloprotease FtsH [Candidatus Berkelbacteria bacterium]
MNIDRRLKNILYFVLALVIVGALIQFATSTPTNVKKSTISEIAEAVHDKKIDHIKIENNTIRATLKDGQILEAFKESQSTLKDYGITPDQVAIDIENPEKGSLVPNVLSFVLPFVLVGLFLYFMMRSAQGANVRALSFGKSQARLFEPGQKRITFADVAGGEEAKQELVEVVEFLRYPEKFHKLGAEIPKGVLLIGPAGTGKTLMARAVAGEANVPFFSISASEFVEMFVGVGAARVRDLFQKAKRNAPAILFIDELDAVGRQRGAGLGGSHDEREQTLNQILVEMDGFEQDTRVVVMAATNRPDILDPALVRPGRFDRRVVIDLPDRADRQAILKIHVRGKPLSSNVHLDHIAGNTPGFSGADLRNVVNEAAIFAARRDRKEITMADFNEAVEKVILGPERRSRILSPAEKQITAYHEAGHAIVAKALPNCDPVHKVSVISRGIALGFTWTRPTEDRHLISRSKFEDDLAQLLGGRVAEDLVFHETTTGASNDLRRATQIARDMVTQYGMSKQLGPVTLGEREELVFLGRELGERKTYSEKIAQSIDAE